MLAAYDPILQATSFPPATGSEPPSQKSFCTSTMISARSRISVLLRVAALHDLQLERVVGVDRLPGQPVGHQVAAGELVVVHVLVLDDVSRRSGSRLGGDDRDLVGVGLVEDRPDAVTAWGPAA